MVLDTRTLDSFYDLAAVVRDFTTPSRGSPELTQEQKDQACRLRAEHGWHAWHIAEAMGLGTQFTRKTGIGKPLTWEENIIEALEGCMYRRDWGGSSGRPIRGLGRTAGRGEELHPSEVTVEGPNDLGAFRTSARRNAIIQAVLSPGRTGTPDIPGAGGRPRQIGRRAIKAGKDKSAKEIAAQANAIIANEIRGGLYKGVETTDVRPQNVTNLAQEIGDLLDWQGRLQAKGIQELPREERNKVKAEIIRRCNEQAKITPETPPIGWYGDLAKDVYLTFKCCGPDGNETMEEMNYQPLHPNIGAEICRVDEKIFKARPTLKSQVDDPENQQKVKDAIAGLTTPPVASDVMKQTGFGQRLVEGILAELGYLSQGARSAALGKIVLPLHNDKKLTPTQMWDQTPELQKLFSDKKEGVQRIYNNLLVAKLTPWTIATIREDRVLPIVADNLREMLQNHLRQEAQDDVWLARIRQNVRAQAPPGRIFESLGTERELTVDGVAALIKETPAFTRKVIEVLAAETPQFVALRGEELVVPFSGLQWIVRGGE